MVSHEERKISRMDKIKRTLEKSKDPDIERLIAMGIVEWGCSRRTMLEYINSVLIYLRKPSYQAKKGTP